jgi:hypothetical protein
MKTMTDLTSIERPRMPDAVEKGKIGEVITVNFKDGAIVGKVQFDGEGGIPKFLRDMAKFAKRDKVKSVVVLTINEDQHVDWVHVADSEHHLALAALCLDDIKEELKGAIFREDEA